MFSYLQGQIQEFWLGGGEELDYFFNGMESGPGPSKGPQWVQGNALVGALGAKPPEAKIF